MMCQHEPGENRYYLGPVRKGIRDFLDNVEFASCVHCGVLGEVATWEALRAKREAAWSADDIARAKALADSYRDVLPEDPAPAADPPRKCTVYDTTCVSPELCSASGACCAGGVAVPAADPVATAVAAERASKDRAYAERNKLVAALARIAPVLGGRAWLAQHDPADATWEDDWRTIVFIETPATGQLSWHLHDSDVPAFAFLRPSINTWDGHTTEEKYARLERIGTAGASLLEADRARCAAVARQWYENMEGFPALTAAIERGDTPTGTPGAAK